MNKHPHITTKPSKPPNSLPERSSTRRRRSRNTSAGSASSAFPPKSSLSTSGVSVSTRASRQMQASPTCDLCCDLTCWLVERFDCTDPTPCVPPPPSPSRRSTKQTQTQGPPSRTSGSRSAGRGSAATRGPAPASPGGSPRPGCGRRSVYVVAMWGVRGVRKGPRRCCIVGAKVNQQGACVAERASNGPERLPTPPPPPSVGFFDRAWPVRVVCVRGFRVESIG